jgi:hypothetical protein
MLEVIKCNFDDFTEEEKEIVPNNGNGMKYAGYIKIIHNGETILLESDAMEKEDAIFARDLNWIYEACRRCYEIGRQEGEGKCAQA